VTKNTFPFLSDGKNCFGYLRSAAAYSKEATCGLLITALFLYNQTSSINFMLHNSFINPCFLNMSAQDVQALLRLMTTGRNKLTLALAMQRMKTLQTAGIKRYIASSYQKSFG
jgi:hypothetical protein